MNILAIETSCDETAAAVVGDGTKILNSVVASSTDLYKKYGGIVPEIAAREQLKCIVPVICEALQIFGDSAHQAGSSAGIELMVQGSEIKNIIDENIDAI